MQRERKMTKKKNQKKKERSRRERNGIDVETSTSSSMRQLTQATVMIRLPLEIDVCGSEHHARTTLLSQGPPQTNERSSSRVERKLVLTAQSRLFSFSLKCKSKGTEEEKRKKNDGVPGHSHVLDRKLARACVPPLSHVHGLTCS